MLLKSVNSIVIKHTIGSSFISKWKRGASGQVSEEKERERGIENEHRLMADLASVVKRTVRKYTCLINKMVNIWNDCY